MTESDWKAPSPPDPITIARGHAGSALEALNPLRGSERRKVEREIAMLEEVLRGLEKAQRG